MTNPYRGPNDPTQIIPGVPQPTHCPPPTQVMPTMPPAGPSYAGLPHQGQVIPPYPLAKKRVWPWIVIVIVVVSLLAAGGTFILLQRGLIPMMPQASTTPSATPRRSTIPTRPPVSNPAPKTVAPAPVPDKIDIVIAVKTENIGVYTVVMSDGTSKLEEFSDKEELHFSMDRSGLPGVLINVTVTSSDPADGENSCRIKVNGQVVAEGKRKTLATCTATMMN